MIFDGDREQLGHYVREMADLCGLRDWTFRVDEGEPGNEHWSGSCEVVYGRKYAIIRFAPGWADQAPEDLRNTCVHELIHCHVKPMEWTVNNTQDHLPPAMFGMLTAGYSDSEELAVDGIATAWAERLPLPMLAEKKGKAKP